MSEEITESMTELIDSYGTEYLTALEAALERARILQEMNPSQMLTHRINFGYDARNIRELSDHIETTPREEGGRGKSSR